MKGLHTNQLFVCLLLLAMLFAVSGCGTTARGTSSAAAETEEKMETAQPASGGENSAVIPTQLEQIPEGYFTSAQQQGTLERLDYETYEAFSYASRTQPLSKTAYVYLPYGYDEKRQYDIFYFMHGGWSNETSMLGTLGNPGGIKNMLDHAIQDGKIEPLIVVCPTYNNTSREDSGDYILALQLTDLYHQELVNDLIPAVESKYSTYAEDVSPEGIAASRDHRGFGGFSMGSVATWRTFEHCLDEFHYFMPMSGSVGDGGIQDVAVDKSGWDWSDFFIFTASGTSDFAYYAFKSQVMNMADLPSRNFRMADNERDGNLSFREQEGAAHDFAAMAEYTYNGLCFFWPGKSPVEAESQESGVPPSDGFTLQSTVGEVVRDAAFGDFGRLLFPVDRAIDEEMTLEEVTTSSVFVWYTNLKPEETVLILNELKASAEAGEPIFHRFYSENEVAEDASKGDTGLFFFGGERGRPYAILNAGGGFAYVAAMQDSFPQARAVSALGFPAFALIYRSDDAYEDLAAAVVYLNDHAEELGVDPSGYSLWGGSAGARMAAALGNAEYLKQLTGRGDIPQAATVVTQYTGYSTVSEADAPTYACVGDNDGIANWETMRNRLDGLTDLGIPTEFHVYSGLGHGFGLGTGTVAEGWISDAVAFWQHQVAGEKE